MLVILGTCPTFLVSDLKLATCGICPLKPLIWQIALSDMTSPKRIVLHHQAHHKILWKVKKHETLWNQADAPRNQTFRATCILAWPPWTKVGAFSGAMLPHSNLVDLSDPKQSHQPPWGNTQALGRCNTPKNPSPTQAPQQNKEDVMKKQIVTTTAEPQWIVTARSLCHVQYRDGNQGGLPRIYPNARAKVRCLGGLEGGVLGPAQQPTGMLLDRVEGLPGLW